jgi:hypothetical protein
MVAMVERMRAGEGVWGPHVSRTLYKVLLMLAPDVKTRRSWLVAPNAVRSEALSLLYGQVRRGELREDEALRLHERLTEVKISPTARSRRPQVCEDRSMEAATATNIPCRTSSRPSDVAQVPA